MAPCYQPAGFEGRVGIGPVLTRLFSGDPSLSEPDQDPAVLLAALTFELWRDGKVADETLASEVGGRYARALLELSVETGAEAAVEADLLGLERMLAASADLRTLVVSPGFTAEEKAAGLAAVAARAGACETTCKFLGLLAANRRANALPAVIAAFKRMAAARRGLIAAKVVSAAPLTKAQAKSLADALRAALGRDPQIETEVDPSLLGGIKVRVGSRLYDASLKSKLDSLKFALKRA